MTLRKPDTGCVRPYRPCPPDFVEVFLRLGQDRAIEEHFRTNWRCIRRWIEENGGDELRARRAAITGAPLYPGRRSRVARDYVLGLRLRSASSRRAVKVNIGQQPEPLPQNAEQPALEPKGA